MCKKHNLTMENFPIVLQGLERNTVYHVMIVKR